jgi:hypothetical protein
LPHFVSEKSIHLLFSSFFSSLTNSNFSIY